MAKNGLRIDIVVRDPVSGKVYRKKNSPVDIGVSDMYSFITLKYRQEKKRTTEAINNDMTRRT